MGRRHRHAAVALPVDPERAVKRLLPALLLAACLAAAVDAATFRRGSAAEPNTLDPHLATGNTAGVIITDITLGLTALDRRGKVAPGAAESWTISADQLTYTFRLRPNLKWSDGSPLTSEDFLWSARRLVTPATASRFVSFVYPVKNARAIVRGKLPPTELGIAAPDLRTVVYTLEYPAPYFLENLSAGVAAPVPRRQIEQFGRQWTKPGQMLSNGAYRLVEVVPQSYVAVEKNPHFFDAANVQVERVEYHPTQNLETSLRRYRAGELDLILNFPSNELARLKREVPKELRITPALATVYLAMNLTKPPFNDARVRRALSLALDREGLVDKFLGEGYRPAWTLVPHSISGYRPPVSPDRRRPAAERLAEARKLLQAAGYGPSKPLQFQLSYESLEDNRRQVVAMAAMWKAIGVEAKPLATDLNGLNRDVRTGRFEMLRYNWWAPNDDPYSFLGLVETGNSGNNVNYSNPDYDQALATANATLDNARRLQLLSAAEAMLLPEEPVIPLFYWGRRLLLKPYVQGFEDSPRGVNPSRYVSIRK